MNPAITKISTFLDCDEEEARYFCTSVQSEFKEPPRPPFKVIATALSEQDTKSIDPAELAEFIKKKGWQKKRRGSLRMTLRPPSLRKIGWISTKKDFLVDESGFIVPNNILKDIQKSTQRKISSICPKSKTTRKVKVFAELRSTFRSLDQLNKEKRKSKGRTSRRKRNKVLIQCPNCTSKVRIDRMKKHLERVHNQAVDDQYIRTLSRSSPPPEQKKTVKRNGESQIATDKKEQFRQSTDEKKYGGKYLGFMRRESGKFGSLPLYEDHDDEANANEE